MFQVSYPFMFGVTTKFNRHGDFAPRICAPLVCVWPACLPKYAMPSVHYVRHHTRVIQTSLVASLLVYIIMLHLSGSSAVSYLPYSISGLTLSGAGIASR